MNSRRLLAFVAMVATAVASSGCGECTATSSCGSTSPRIAIDGQIVDRATGRGVDGVHLRAVRTAGVTLVTDTFAVTTSGGGFWHVESPATQAGDAVFTFTVQSPAMADPYIVSGRHVSTVDRGGDAVQFERWVSQLYAPYYFDVFLRGVGTPLPNTTINLIRRGTDWTPGATAADSVIGLQTDGTGRAYVYIVASDTGDVVADVVTTLPAPYHTSVTRSLHLHTTYVYHVPGAVLQIPAGPSLDYAIQLYDRATGHIVPGAAFQATRVGGVATDISSTSGVSDKDGYVRLPFHALADGNVVLDITYHSPRGSVETYRDTLPTFDDNAGRLFTNQNIGPYLNYYGLLESGFNSPLVGVPVRIRRTGGIDISPSDTTVLTTRDGAVELNAIPATAGDVVLELTFNLPGNLPRFMVSNIVVSTMQQDFPLGKTLWVWDVNVGLSGPPGSHVTPLP